MNNTKYLDVCEDLIPTDFLLDHEAKELFCDYKKEIKLGEEFELSYGLIDGSYWFVSDHFVIRIVY